MLQKFDFVLLRSLVKLLFTAKGKIYSLST